MLLAIWDNSYILQLLDAFKDVQLYQQQKIKPYASQDTEIFSGTILDNVLYPQSKSTASVEKIKAAQNILEQLGFNLDRWNRDVGESGSSLSGGEKKRLAFARAILRPSKILLLDEITSNLDSENEAIVANLIIQESEKRCVVLITHKDIPIEENVQAHNLGKGSE